MKSIFNKSISELEGWKWVSEIPTEQDSYVVRNYYRLHNVPINEYNLDDIRFMIGQNAGLEYLVPIALEQLTKNIFIEAEYYPGDLYCALLSINDDPIYWENHPEQKQTLIALYTDQIENLESTYETEVAIKNIKRAYSKFLDQ